MAQRLYGLFERAPDGKWQRLHPLAAHPINIARRVWQDALLAHVLHGTPERRLIPVRD